MSVFARLVVNCWWDAEYIFVHQVCQYFHPFFDVHIRFAFSFSQLSIRIRNLLVYQHQKTMAARIPMALSIRQETYHWQDAEQQYDHQVCQSFQPFFVFHQPTIRTWSSLLLSILSGFAGIVESWYWNCFLCTPLSSIILMFTNLCLLSFQCDSVHKLALWVGLVLI